MEAIHGIRGPKEKPIVRCVAAVDLNDRSDDAVAAPLRQLKPGELLELLEGGSFEEETWEFFQEKCGFYLGTTGDLAGTGSFPIGRMKRWDFFMFFLGEKANEGRQQEMFQQTLLPTVRMTYLMVSSLQ